MESQAVQALEEAAFLNDGPELLVNLAQKLEARLRTVPGLNDVAARSLGVEIALAVAQDWGGQLIYIPKGKAFQQAKTHLEIFAKFNGHNHVQLAQEYDMTVPSIYRIVKKVLTAERSKRQPSLFPDDSATR